MCERLYAIEMQTPMGKKQGTIRVITEQETMNGYLTVLDHSTPFTGSIDGEGHCKFTGSIVTLMRTIDYEASGKMEDDSISLDIHGERNVFQVVGKRSHQTEAEQKGRL
ncbi:MAG: hypothetical protein Q4C50_09160 [Eubacteriales bacterium]|nr:hypothetical protein [Eubacteriales bacterium]